jgi:membrane protease YdiL (CAAX protease family)
VQGRVADCLAEWLRNLGALQVSMDAVAAAVAVALLIAATLAPAIRVPVFFLECGLLGLALGGRRPSAWLVAGLMPLSLRLAWAGTFPAPPPSLAECADPLSPTAVARVIEASIVIGSVAVMALALGGDRRSLALAWPTHATAVVAAAAPALIVPAALVVGPLLAGPFFGAIRIDVTQPAAFLPAFALALSNAGVEELVFRGAILGWGGRAIGFRPALVLQAVLFGLAHAGGDFLDPLVMLPVLLAMTAGGLVAGLIVRRTGSLLLPLAVHAAFDVPLYYAFACRLSG